MTQPTPADRIPLDELTSDAYDALHADLDWARRQALAAQQEATEAVTRAERAETAIERVRKALAERRAEIADYEAENETAPWSDAAANTCSRIEDALAEHPEPQGIRAALDEHQEQQPDA